MEHKKGASNKRRGHRQRSLCCFTNKGTHRLPMQRKKILFTRLCLKSRHIRYLTECWNSKPNIAKMNRTSWTLWYQFSAIKPEIHWWDHPMTQQIRHLRNNYEIKKTEQTIWIPILLPIHAVSTELRALPGQYTSYAPQMVKHPVCSLTVQAKKVSKLIHKNV